MPDQCKCLTPEEESKKRLFHYLGAIILGMNDAIIEMTGALAGFTIALGNNRLIILAGITTGVAATLSMACAEFMAEKVDEKRTSPYISAACTGFTYILIVAFLLLPYFCVTSPGGALALSLLGAAAIIFVFTSVVSRLKKTSFIKNFLKMLVTSFIVAAIAFFISWLAELYWGIPV